MLKFDKKLTQPQGELLRNYFWGKHMKRDEKKLMQMDRLDSNRVVLGLLKETGIHIGPDCANYVGYGPNGIEVDVSVIDPNTPPSGVPSFRTPFDLNRSNDGLNFWKPKGFGISEAEANDACLRVGEWITYLQANFLKPWGVTIVSGEIENEGVSYKVVDGILSKSLVAKD